MDNVIVGVARDLSMLLDFWVLWGVTRPPGRDKKGEFPLAEAPAVSCCAPLHQDNTLCSWNQPKQPEPNLVMQLELSSSAGTLG